MNNPSDSWLYIHNTSTREVVKSTWFEDHVVDADWSPDGEYLALLTSSNLINIYQPSNWAGDDWEGEDAVSTFQANSAFPGGIKYSPDGSMIAVVSFYDRWTEINGNIEIYAPLSGELLMQGTPDQEYGKWHENDYYYSVGWNLDGSKLAVSGYEVMYIYDVESWTMELAIPEAYMVLQSIDYSPDGTMIAACSGWGDDNNHENFIAVYNATSGSKMWSYASTTPCLDVAWSPDSVLEIYCEGGIPNATDIFDPSWHGFPGKAVYNADKWAEVDDIVNLMLSISHPGTKVYHEPYNNAVVNIGYCFN